MAGASVTKSAELFRLPKKKEKEGKISPQKQNSGRKRKLSDRDRRTLTGIVRKDPKNTVPKITAELNDHLEKPVCSKTVKRKLHNIYIYIYIYIYKRAYFNR